MRKTFAAIATTITIMLIIISLAYAFNSLANSATANIEADWQLTVTGLVANPLNLNWIGIVAMPKSTVNTALICVDFPWQIVAQGNWTGIKLQTLLEEAKPSASAIKVAFYAADGYSTDLPLETAMRDDVILAYEKDGSPLNDLRLVVPGKWGYKWISQLTRIELVNYDFLGFWESRGYPDEADITPSSPSTNQSTPSPPETSAPPPSPTAPPTTSPSPSPSSPSVTSPEPSQPTPTPEHSSSAIPKETVYAIAAAVTAVVLVLMLTFVRRRKNNKS